MSDEEVLVFAKFVIDNNIKLTLALLHLLKEFKKDPNFLKKLKYGK